MRSAWLIASVVLAAGTARADDAAVDAVGPDPDDAPAAAPAAAELRVEAGAGAIAGAPASAVAIGAAVERPWLTLALAARARVVGDRFITEDWDDGRDLAALVRTVVVRNRAARDRTALVATDATGAEVAAGALARLELGSGGVVAGAVPAVDAVAHPGVHARLTGPRWAAELAVDDVLAPRLVAAAGRAPVGGWIAGATVAVDPRVPPSAMADAMATDVLAAAGATVARPLAGPTWTGAIYGEAAALFGDGAGVHAGARGAVRAGDAVVSARVEATAGTAGWTAAPFGPLHRVLATELAARAAEGRLGGVGGAARVALDRAWLRVAAGARHRPGLGTELDGELAWAAGPVEVAVWTAATTGPVDRFALVAEARLHLARRLQAGLDLGRLYRRELGLDDARGSWHALVWFGAALTR